MSTGLLERIVERTRESLVVRKAEQPLHKIVAAAPTPGGRRSFARSLRTRDRISVIAEFKRRSPSRGLIRDDLHPVQVAQAYEVAGAAALSVLTEEQYFGGSLEDLQQARAATLLPTLRKDFIVDPYQIWEAKAWGASAALLIVAALPDERLRDLRALLQEVELDALVEVHTVAEADRALAAGATILGVNNRDLATFETDLAVTARVGARAPGDVLLVSESGIRSRADVLEVERAGARAVLVGEALVTAGDPGAKVKELIG